MTMACSIWVLVCIAGYQELIGYIVEILQLSWLVKVIHVIGKKQMYDSIIMGKENISEAWNFFYIDVSLTSFNVYLFVFCLVMHVLYHITYVVYIHALKLQSGYCWREFGNPYLYACLLCSRAQEKGTYLFAVTGHIHVLCNIDSGMQ